MTTTQVSPLKLLTLGYSVIPSGGGESGKAPLVNWAEYQGHPPTETELEQWETTLKPALWGVVTGGISKVFIIDIDKPEQKPLMDAAGLEPHIKTPKGWHYWFAHPGAPVIVKTMAGLLPGVDVRGDGGFVNVIGRRKDGGEYSILKPITPDNLYKWKQLPADLIEALKNAGRKTSAEAPAPVISQGGRNHHLTSVAGSMRRRGMSHEAIEAALLQENQDKCDPPLDINEVKNIAASVSRYAPSTATAPREPGGNGHKNPSDLITTINFTDAENGEYFTSMYGDRLRYDHRRGRWLEWFNHFWRPDSDRHITRLALKSIRRRYQDTVNIEDADTRKAAVRKAISCEQRARIEAALAMAHDFKPIADAGENWDKNPWLLAAKNGVIELQTGNIRPGEQSDLITMTTPVEYQSDAEAPRWMQFLNEVFKGNTELIHWLQKYFGYCLTGSTREQIIPIGYGRGANGKTVLLAVTRHVIGDYAYDAPFSTFELASRSAIPNDIAALDGKRFVTSSETTEGSRFNEARIKSLTGCDSMTARFLHAEYFTFQPVAKFFLAVNTRPRVHDDSYGFWRRVRLIPFTQQFKGASDDKELTGKLIAESPGILAWMVEGCLLWQSEGMDPAPECITAATREYEAESDPLSEFILDECIIKPEVNAPSGELHRAYRVWAAAQGMTEKETLTLTAFGRRMGQKFAKYTPGNIKTYRGICLKNGTNVTSFVTSFVADDNETDVISNLLYAREKEPENPSPTSNTGTKDGKTSNNPQKELPPYPEKLCPKCGSEWMVAPDGHSYICEKGHRLKE